MLFLHQTESDNRKGDDKNQNDSDGDTKQNQRKQKPRKNAKSDGIIQQILNDDKKSHEKYLKTEFKKGQVRNNLNDW